MFHTHVHIRYGGGMNGSDPTAAEWRVDNEPSNTWYGKLYCFLFPTRCVAEYNRSGFYCYESGFEWTKDILKESAKRAI